MGYFVNTACANETGRAKFYITPNRVSSSMSSIYYNTPNRSSSNGYERN